MVPDENLQFLFSFVVLSYHESLCPFDLIIGQLGGEFVATDQLCCRKRLQIAYR